MKLHSNLTVVLLALSTCAFGAVNREQPNKNNENEDDYTPRIALWQASVGKNCKISIAVSQLVSVSMHPYMLNGETKVTEVTVDTLGNNTIRFYYIHSEKDESNRTEPQSVLKNARRTISRQLSDQKSDNEIASIKFPEGAYAHTVEYQVSSLSQLDSLYKSLISVWSASNTKKLTSYENEEEEKDEKDEK